MIRRLKKWLKSLAEPKHFYANFKYTSILSSLIYDAKSSILTVKVTKDDGSDFILENLAADVPYAPKPIYFDVGVPVHVKKIELLVSPINSDCPEVVSTLEDVAPGRYRLEYEFKSKKLCA